MYEVWKDVVGYEGLYQVSNNGQVKSMDRIITNTKGVTRRLKGVTLKQSYDSYGYLRVTLCKNNKKKNVLVHRLVASAFLENNENLPEVNHKNEVKTDNRVDNLEFCTSEYNTNYGTRNQKINQYRKKKVVGTCLKTKKNIYYDSISDTKKDGFTIQSVSLCCQGKRLKTHKGFKWEFIPEGVANV